MTAADYDLIEPPLKHTPRVSEMAQTWFEQVSPINLLTLRFTRGACERAYSSRWCQRQEALDRVGCFISLLQLFAGIAFIKLKDVPTPPHSLVLLVFSGLLHGLHAVLLQAPAFRYSKHRTAVVVSVLLLLRLLTASTVSYTPSMSGTTMRLMYRTGIIPLCWYGITLPLLFRQQVLAQLAAVLLYHGNLSVPACKVLGSDPLLLSVLEGVWDWVRSGLALTLQVQGINIQQTISATEDPLLLCWSTTGFLLLLLGLLLPAPVWYCLELRSRAAFYKLWQQQQQQEQEREQGRQRLVSGRRSAAAPAAAAAVAAGPGTSGGSLPIDAPLAAAGSSMASAQAGLSTAGSNESPPSRLNPASTPAVRGDEGLAPASAPVPEPPGFNVEEVFEVHLVSLAMVLVALTACSCLMLMSCGPQLLWLQLQLSQV